MLSTQVSQIHDIPVNFIEEIFHRLMILTFSFWLGRGGAVHPASLPGPIAKDPA